MAELVAVNGEIFKPDEARISVFDRGFLFGDGVYEVVRSYGRVLFAVEYHLDRLFNSASRIDLDLGVTKENLQKEIYRVYKEANQDDMYVRIVVTRGTGQKINIDPNQPLTPNVVIYVKTLEKVDPKHYVEGDEPCEVSYSAKRGKYMAQTGVTLPRL